MVSCYATLSRNEKAVRLLEAMLEGLVVEIKPQFDPQLEAGFSFPQVSRLLGTTEKESQAVLESLAEQGVLVRKFWDKLLSCPQCHSPLLRPFYNCAKCSSSNIARGRVLEHLSCKHVGLEDEFFFRGRLVCPRCKLELRTLDIDYRSLGVLYQCRDCRDVAAFPALKWRCLRCAAAFSADKVEEVNVYSYSLNEEKRNWLAFELKPRPRLVQFLRERSYVVEENGRLAGRSGVEHTFAMLATRPLGILDHRVGIDVQIDQRPIELERVFDFDDKAYDCGINYKVLIAIPGLAPEAERFAARQRITVLDLTAVERLLSRTPPSPKQPAAEVEEQPFRFTSRRALVQYLQGRGYEVKENGRIKGQSGAEHSFDIVATRDDLIVVHNVVIGILVDREAVEIERVFQFDARAYDCGITDKVLIAVPGLSREAARFAQRQRIRVFEATAAER